MPGLDVLRALDEAPTPIPEVLGLALWRALGAIQLWTDSPAHAREGLFSAQSPALSRIADAAAAAPELADALATVAHMHLAPQDTSPSAVAGSCHSIRNWACERGLLVPALHFAEAAAAAQPTNPQWAMEAGLLSWKAGGPRGEERAIVWLDRANGLAASPPYRRGTVWLRTRVIKGHLLRDAALRDPSLLPDARAEFEAVIRRARSRMHWQYVGRAEHHLVGVAGLAGRCDIALGHARRALDHYGPRAEWLPYLAHDVAYICLMHGLHSTAHALVDSVPRNVVPREENLLVNGTRAWAAAGAGHSELFRDAAAITIQGCTARNEYAPNAMLNVAEGARLSGDWELARQCASQAHALAANRGEAVIATSAEALLHRIEARTPAVYAPLPPTTYDLTILKRKLESRLRCF